MKKKSMPSTLAVFVTIVGTLLLPLSQRSDIFMWPCSRMAISVCLFFIGCVIAEYLNMRLNKTWKAGVACLAVICLVQYFYMDAMHLDVNIDKDLYHLMLGKSIMLNCMVFYLSFLFLGILIHSGTMEKHDEITGIKTTDKFAKDLVSGSVCFAVFLAMWVLPRTEWVFPNTSEGLRFLLRIIRLIPWSATLIYVYRCATSDKVVSFMERRPKITKVAAGICPIVVAYVLFTLSDILGS